MEVLNVEELFNIRSVDLDVSAHKFMKHQSFHLLHVAVCYHDFLFVVRVDTGDDIRVELVVDPLDLPWGLARILE